MERKKRKLRGEDNGNSHYSEVKKQYFKSGPALRRETGWEGEGNMKRIGKG